MKYITIHLLLLILLTILVQLQLGITNEYHCYIADIRTLMNPKIGKLRDL